MYFRKCIIHVALFPLRKLESYKESQYKKILRGKPQYHFLARIASFPQHSERGNTGFQDILLGNHPLSHADTGYLGDIFKKIY